MPSRSSPGDVVQAHLAAFSARDLPTMLATLAPDAVYVTGTEQVAPQQFQDFFGQAMREIDPMMQVATLVVDGRHVACEFLETVTLDGERKQLKRAAFYTVDDGVITSAKVYDERE